MAVDTKVNHYIENEYLKVSVKSDGAELTSIYNKATSTELLWQADPAYWGRHAPILFPIVGELKEGFYTYNSKKYELARHGFVRNLNWTLEKIDGTTLKCSIAADKDTKSLYPFNFELIITYHLKEQTLDISHEVINHGKEIMPFSIGGHPAFNCPVDKNTSYSDYSLEFKQKENSARHFLNEKGLFNGKTALVLDNTQTYVLETTSFVDDALVFKDLKSKAVTLCGPNGKLLTVTYNDFQFLGIWAKPGAPYVCIEPWVGHADTIESVQDLFKKEGSKTLNPKSNYIASYQIKAH